MPVRIYEISKKLGLESKEVLAKARELGITAAKVASSTLDKITAEYLEKEILAALPAPPAPVARPPPRPLRRPPRRPDRAGITAMQRALILLLRQPKLASRPDLPMGWQGTPIPGATLLAEVLTLCRQSPEITAAQIVERYRGGEHHRHLSRLAGMDLEAPEAGEALELIGALQRLNEQALERETELLLEQAARRALTPEEKERLRWLTGEARRRTGGGEGACGGGEGLS